jgi:RimJ/RimL family protein N-acetyltransferase
MSEKILKAVPLRDSRRAEIAYASSADAADMLAYVEVIAAETDYVTFGPGEFGLTLEQEVAFLQSLADHSRGLMLLARCDGAMVGNCMLGRSTRPRIRHVGELGLSVCQQFWGNGIARELCKTLFVEAMKVGITRVALRVRADNERAIRLYESLGFQHEGRLVGAFIARGVIYDELAMGLRI